MVTISAKILIDSSYCVNDHTAITKKEIDTKVWLYVRGWKYRYIVLGLDFTTQNIPIKHNFQIKFELLFCFVNESIYLISSPICDQ